MNIIDVPEELKNPTNFVYPPGNEPNFEEYFYNYIIKNNVSLKRYYIPIFWQNYFFSKASIISKNGIDKLYKRAKKIIDRLDLTKKYFTICGFDFGLPIDLSNKDILIFAQQHDFINFKSF